MQKTGKVTFSNGEPSLGDGTRLAICDDPSPFVAAGTFLRNRGIRSGQTITVTGDDGEIDGESVFCMTDATQAASLAAAPRKKATAKRTAAKKTTSRSTAPKRSASGKPTKRSPGNKARAKKTPAKPRKRN